MADDDEPVDEEAMMAEWEAMAGMDDEDGDGGDGDSDGEGEDQDAMAAEWEAMADDGDDAGGDDEDEDGVPGRVLDQDEIDSLLGFDGDDGSGDMTGIHALINSALVSYERLPMLDIVFDRMVRMMSTSLRN